MAFVPFVESDQPTMAAFNEKFQQNYEATIAAAGKVETGSYVGTGTTTAVKITCSFTPKLIVIAGLSVGETYTHINMGLVSEIGGVALLDNTNYYGVEAEQLKGMAVSVSGNEVAISANDNGKYWRHCNLSGVTYNWVAIA